MEQPVAVDLNTMAIQCPDDLDEKFFFYWFQTVDLAKLDNGSTIPQVNNGDIAPLEFPEPGRKEQHEIVRRVEALFAYADKLEACYNTARAQVERLTPALLAKAFRGELVPQDPNDEPASVLLERIHALSVGRNKRSVSGGRQTPETACGLIPAYEKARTGLCGNKEHLHASQNLSSFPYATLLHTSMLSFRSRSYLDLYCSPQG